MAGEQTVEVEDAATVTVEVDGLGVPEPTAEEPGEKAGIATRTATADAAAQLQDALKKYETEQEARKAAEATAQSERQRATEASRLAQQREDEANRFREQAENHELVAITTGIEKANRDMESAQAEIERAQEAGDFKAAAKAGGVLARAAAALDRLEADKAAFEAGARKGQATTEGRVEAPPAGSAFEQYVSQFPPKAQAYLRSHPDCVPPQVGGDARKNARMMKGHFSALEEGIQEGTERYFEIIDQHVTGTSPTSAAAETTAAVRTEARPKPAAARQPAPSAPVTRDPPNSNGQPSRRTVTLTPQQQEIAKLSFPQKQGEADMDWAKRAFGTYAHNLLAAQAEGKIGRLTH